MRQRFVVTPWRDDAELLQLRQRLYWRPESGDEDKREAAVNKILAWKVRQNEIPLLLESTADLVDAVVQDERGCLPQQSLKLLYAAAIARFATGISDTSTDLQRARPSWLPTHLQSTFLSFPPHILETRHSIVHRQLPTLAELKTTAKESLDWLWEWYWSQLDNAFAAQKRPPVLLSEEEKDRLRAAIQGLLKTYVRDRKAEITALGKRAKGLALTSKAASTATTSYLSICSAGTVVAQGILVQLLVQEKWIVPKDKKTGSSMSGAFLIWMPFLAQLMSSQSGFLGLLGERLFEAMNAPRMDMQDVELDPAREAMYEWLVHVATTQGLTRDVTMKRKDVENMLERCFTEPTTWNLRLAEAILAVADVGSGKEMWKALLIAAKDEGGSGLGEGGVEEEMQGLEAEEPKSMVSEKGAAEIEKHRGPRKVVGLWRPKPIGFVPEGWEDDE